MIYQKLSFLSICLAGSLLLADGKINDISKKTFVEVGLGSATQTIQRNEDTSAFVSSNAYDQDAIVADFSIGHYIDQNWLTKATLQSSKFDINTITNIFFSLNYQIEIDDSEFNPYVGAVFGYSDLEWERDPILEAVEQLKRSQSILYGLEAGVEYKIDDSFSIVAKAQAFKDNHITNIKQNMIKQNNQVNIIFGVKYEL